MERDGRERGRKGRRGKGKRKGRGREGRKWPPLCKFLDSLFIASDVLDFTHSLK